MLRLRAQMSEIEVRNKSEKIFNNVVNSKWYKDSKVIMIYVSFKNEACTNMLIDKAISDKKIVLVPVCIDKENMIASKITNTDNMHLNRYGISEPKNIEKYCDKIDVCIVPAVAFDKGFNRVGFGAGYYDRFFEKIDCKYKIGLCYKNQLIDNIPTNEFDIKMNVIITEEGIMVNND